MKTQNSKKAFILLNGTPPFQLPNLKNYKIVCAVDGAYNHFVKSGIEPDLVTGDFDSIDNIPTHIEAINTDDQEFADFHKTLTILKERGHTNIDVYGASGQEQDHFLGNISTALQWKDSLNLRFFDDYGSYVFIDKKFTKSDIKGKIVSLIPFPTASGIITKGLLYPLNNESLTFGERIGTRNTAEEDTIEITFNEGALLVYVGK
ncbi:MAG: thiamine diphosphokinase [Flavobacteriaceae bacterium]|nr:MAG: thiamine diphosphokinase [Flavobacteriaceae bacterium]